MKLFEAGGGISARVSDPLETAFGTPLQAVA